MRKNRMNRNLRGGFRLREDGTFANPAMERLSRSGFLKAVGAGAAAVGAATYGLGGTAKAAWGGEYPVLENYNVVQYIGKNVLHPDITNGHWFDQTPGDRYGNCAWILSAMCVPIDYYEWPVQYGFHDYDIFGGPLMDCVNYAIYTCKSTAGCDPRFLEDYEETQRRATCWFNNGTKTITLNVPEPNCYQLAVYVLDKDSTIRTESITVTDSQGTSSPASISGFSQGKYVIFYINPGTVTINVTHTGGGANAVISGLFLDPLGECSVPTQLVGYDGATKGDWVGVYGSYWYLLCSWNHPNNLTNDPSVLVSDGGMGHYAWTNYCDQGSGVCNILEQDKGKSVSFAWSWGNRYPESALLVPPQSEFPQVCDRVAGSSTWASTYDDGGENYPTGPDMYVDLHLPDMGECEGTGCYFVTFYAYDPDSDCRSQIFEVYNPETGELLATSAAEDGYVGKGVYHTFYLPKGDYLVKVDYIGCTNAVLSGIFIDCVNCPSGICEPQVYPLIAGAGNPNKPSGTQVGTVTVSNDENNLYVTYTTTGDWYLEETQLYVFDCEHNMPTERLPPGGAPYKSGDISYVQNYTFTVPLSELNFDLICNETLLCLQAHAAVVRIVNSEVVQDETAYGGDIVNPGQGAWYGNIQYLYCCEENGDEPCYDFHGETAWAAGSRYVAKGNWATYTAYVPDQTVTLWAGQNMNAGTVHFSVPVNGEVAITITLNEGWMFAGVPENVKIQDYATAPSGNPAPGLFTWKGTAYASPFSIIVPLNNFYGVHADVGYLVEVPCPE